MIFNNNNTKMSNLEPEVHSVCLTEALKQQPQNNSFKCFYCGKSQSTNKERYRPQLLDLL
jgi:hypothetical protein